MPGGTSGSSSGPGGLFPSWQHPDSFLPGGGAAVQCLGGPGPPVPSLRLTHGPWKRLVPAIATEGSGQSQTPSQASLREGPSATRQGEEGPPCVCPCLFWPPRRGRTGRTTCSRTGRARPHVQPRLPPAGQPSLPQRPSAPRDPPRRPLLPPRAGSRVWGTGEASQQRPRLSSAPSIPGRALTLHPRMACR